MKVKSQNAVGLYEFEKVNMPTTRLPPKLLFRRSFFPENLSLLLNIFCILGEG